jgi:hypothetical protein
MQRVRVLMPNEKKVALVETGAGAAATTKARGIKRTTG